MKICKLCGSTYADKVDFCFRDGQPLVRGEEPAPAPAPVAARGGLRPGLADMLDVPEPGFARPVDPTALPDRGVALPPTGLDSDDPDLRSVLGGIEGAEDLPERAILLERDPSTSESLAGLVDAPLPPPADEDEDLAPPAPLSLAGLATPDPDETPERVAPPMASAHGLTMVPDDEQSDDPRLGDPRLEDLRPVQLQSGGDAAGSLPPGAGLPEDDQLPPPRPLDDGRDLDALADLARTLGGEDDVSRVDDAEAEAEVIPLVSARGSSGAPALDDLVEDGDGKDGHALYIGADGANEGPLYADSPPPANNNKVILALFGAAALVAVVGIIVIATTGGDPTPDPLAGKPEERAAPMVAAPAAAAEPGAQDAVADATLVDPAAVDPTAVDPTAVDPTAVDPTAVDPTAAAPNPAAPTAAPVAAATPATAAAAGRPPVAAATPTGTSTAGTSTAAAASATPVPTSSQATADAAGSDPWNTRAAATSGRLTINSIPSGATVYVDNRQLGRSPLSAELGYGMHTIRVELGGYSSEQRTIDVQVPEMAVPFELKPTVVTGTVNIFGPTGATVLVDGAQVGKIPTSVKLTEGAHSFEVRTTDGSSFSRSQDVRFDGGTTVSVTLSP